MNLFVCLLSAGPCPLKGLSAKYVSYLRLVEHVEPHIILEFQDATHPLFYTASHSFHHFPPLSCPFSPFLYCLSSPLLDRYMG